jgi:hypothetical protein
VKLAVWNNWQLTYFERERRKIKMKPEDINDIVNTLKTDCLNKDVEGLRTMIKKSADAYVSQMRNLGWTDAEISVIYSACVFSPDDSTESKMLHGLYMLYVKISLDSSGDSEYLFGGN